MCPFYDYFNLNLRSNDSKMISKKWKKFFFPLHQSPLINSSPSHLLNPFPSFYVARSPDFRCLLSWHRNQQHFFCFHLFVSAGYSAAAAALNEGTEKNRRPGKKGSPRGCSGGNFRVLFCFAFKTINCLNFHYDSVSWNFGGEEEGGACLRKLLRFGA